MKAQLSKAPAQETCKPTPEEELDKGMPTDCLFVPSRASPFSSDAGASSSPRFAAMSTSCSPPLFICSSGQPKLCAFPRGASSNIMLTPRRLCMERQSSSQRSSRTSALSRGDFSPVTQDVEGFLHNIVNMGFLDRLKLAWKIIFPAPTVTENTNANIAKQRLKMILFSDRCEVSDEAKKKIVENVVAALSEFVEIESRDNVQVDISTDAGLGTVYSVTVPVRRVKPEYQESEEQYRGKIVGVDFKDTGEVSGNVDVTFDFFVPNENH